MDINKTISSIPRPILIFGGFLIILLSYAYWTNQLTTQMQVIIFGLILILILLSIKSKATGITLDEAKRRGHALIRRKVSEGVVRATGSIKESIEGVTRMRQGLPWYHEVCVEMHGSPTRYFVVEYALNGDYIRTTEKDSWKSTDSPHVEIVTPPDIISWMKQKKEIESKMEEMSK